MRDIPMFVTQLGAASLVLSQIPYTGKGYIRIHSSQSPERFLRECADFCRAAGATAVFATGHEILQGHRPETDIQQMRVHRAQLGPTQAVAVAVTKQTLEQFRQLYNQKVIGIPGGAWMTMADAQAHLQAADSYFIYLDHQLIGTGIVSDGMIQWLSSLKNGAGRDVVRALSALLKGEWVCVEVATANEKAMALYTSLGFTAGQTLLSWYKIL